MSQDPYAVLGVAKDAAQDQIRKAYRALAKKYHPDLNPGDAAAADRFKEIAAAYDLLSDPEKRGRFDRGEIDASGAERPQQRYYRDFAEGDGGAYQSSAGYEDFGDVSDLFADLMRRRGRGGPAGAGLKMRGQDDLYHLEVDFLEAVLGAKKRITLPDGQDLDVTIPEGMADGQTLRLRGKGQPGYGGGPPGDALIQVSVRPHPQFQRRDDDILIELPITLDEAILGAKVQVPTLTGRVSVTVPKGADSGKVLRLRGKGVKRAHGHGDQLVTLRVVLPSTVDPELEAFMKEWRKTHAYEVRGAGGVR